MKTFNELPNEEKVVLIEEQVTYYAKLDCAKRGIIIPQKPINELRKVVPPTQKFYQVGYESFVFETEAEAQDYIDSRAKALVIKSVGGNYDSKNQYVDVRNSDYKEIKSVVVYTKEESVELKDILTYNAETQKEWDNYYSSLKEYNEIIESIWEEIQEIKFKNSRVDFYNKVYNDYLELANGVGSIAMTFFSKAYKNADLTELDEEIVKEMINQPQCIEKLDV